VIRATWLLLAIQIVFAMPASAEHQIEYRYTVLGYVTDPAGRPVAGHTVELIRDKTGFSYLGTTGADGFFVIIARLGDESAGESLTLRRGTASVSLVARFDPSNHRDERGTRVDIEAARFVERPTSFQATLTKFLAAPVAR
jgi:hypothetical protein